MVGWWGRLRGYTTGSVFLRASCVTNTKKGIFVKKNTRCVCSLTRSTGVHPRRSGQSYRTQLRIQGHHCESPCRHVPVSAVRGLCFWFNFRWGTRGVAGASGLTRRLSNKSVMRKWWDMRAARTVSLFTKRLSASRFDWPSSNSYDSFVTRIKLVAQRIGASNRGRLWRSFRCLRPLLHHQTDGPVVERRCTPWHDFRLQFVAKNPTHHACVWGGEAPWIGKGYIDADTILRLI